MNLLYSSYSDTSAGLAGALAGLGFELVVIAIAYVIMAIPMAKIFSDNGEPAANAWIPFLNWGTLLRMGGYSPWLAILAIIPIANIVMGVLLAISFGRVASRYGKDSTVWGILFYFFSLIVAYVLAYGSGQPLGRSGYPYANGMINPTPYNPTPYGGAMNGQYGSSASAPTPAWMQQQPQSFPQQPQSFGQPTVQQEYQQPPVAQQQFGNPPLQQQAPFPPANPYDGQQ